MEKALEIALELLTRVVSGGYEGQAGVHCDSDWGATCLHCGSNSWMIPFEHAPNCVIVGIKNFLDSIKHEEKR